MSGALWFIAGFVTCAAFVFAAGWLIVKEDERERREREERPAPWRAKWQKW